MFPNLIKLRVTARKSWICCKLVGGGVHQDDKWWVVFNLSRILDLRAQTLNKKISSFSFFISMYSHFFYQKAIVKNGINYKIKLSTTNKHLSSRWLSGWVVGPGPEGVITCSTNTLNKHQPRLKGEQSKKKSQTCLDFPLLKSLKKMVFSAISFTLSSSFVVSSSWLN